MRRAIRSRSSRNRSCTGDTTRGAPSGGRATRPGHGDPRPRARAGAGNIGEGPRNARMRKGVLAFLVALGLAVLMARLGVHPAVRVLLVVPFFFASNGLYMGLYGA